MTRKSKTKTNMPNVTGRKKRSQVTKSRDVREQITVMPGISRIMFTSANPGRARVHGVFEITSGTAGNAALSFTGFNSWCSQARSILTPFNYFRITDLVLTPMVGGGTANDYTIVSNVSNSAYGIDSSAITILNDDFACMSTSALQPTLHPPRSYWRGGARTWYASTDEASGIPSLLDRSAGFISYIGISATANIVVGWMHVDFEMEFHTLS